MKKIFVGLLLLTAVVAVRFIFLAQRSQDGMPPGLAEQQLAPCPDKQNCVCSEYAQDLAHYVEPIAFPDTAAGVEALVRRAVGEIGGRVQMQTKVYLAATFAVPPFRFIDDLEIRFDSRRRVLHVRSASRVGFSDLGVNRRRVESLRTALHAIQGVQ